MKYNDNVNSGIRNYSKQKSTFKTLFTLQNTSTTHNFSYNTPVNKLNHRKAFSPPS